VELQTDHRCRLLVWVFARGDETVTGELALNEAAPSYEFRLRMPHTGTHAVECFAHLSHAFERESEWEADLVARGWTLANYTSRRIEPRDDGA
jgi:hypothetical protein